jgi:hypothetical protein
MALTKRQLLMVAIESTYGTSSAPAGPEAILVLDPNLTPLDGEILERGVIDPGFGRIRSRVIAQRKMGLEFGVELAGSGTAGTAPKYSPLLRSVGFAETTVSSTTTYSLVTPVTDSVSLNHNWDGNRHLGTGGRGNAELVFEVGAYPRINFSYQGIYNAPTDVAFPTPTYTNQAAPVDFGAVNTPTVTVAGLSACVSSCSINLGNEINFFNHAGCTPSVRITDRMVEGSLTIERPDQLSTKDFYALAIAGTTGAITFTHGTVAGNRVQVNIPYANFGPPTPADANGVAMLTLPFVAIHTPGTSDELTLVYT